MIKNLALKFMKKLIKTAVVIMIMKEKRLNRR